MAKKIFFKHSKHNIFVLFYYSDIKMEKSERLRKIHPGFSRFLLSDVFLNSLRSNIRKHLMFLQSQVDFLQTL
jgi:hypothetical protein